MAARSHSSHRHALLVPHLSDMFQLLGVTGSVWYDDRWRTIYTHSNVAPFEIRYGQDRARVEHNLRCTERAKAEKRAVVGRHGGFSDVFVPIVSAGKVVAFLVTGPIATEPLDTASVLEHWHALSGRQAHPSDPEFAEYLSVLLTTLVLDEGRLSKFVRYLECLASMMAGEGDAKAIFQRAEAVRPDLERARFVDRMWEMVRSMLDERTTRSWPSPQRLVQMWTLGLSRIPSRVMVALFPSANPQAEPVDELVRREALQRASAALALRKGEVACGKHGEQGLTFLLASRDSALRGRQRLLDLGEEVTKLARKHGFRTHLGFGFVRDEETPNQTFRRVLSAAEAALSKGVRLLEAASGPEQPVTLLGDLRLALAKAFDQRPSGVGALLDRYLDVAAVRSGYRLELTRAYAEAAFERLTEGLRERGALEEKSYKDMFESLVGAARQARTVHELCDAYRRSVADLVEALQRPVTARRDRSLQRALTYVREHYTERLTLDAVARVSGFAPNYFSQLFKRREHVSFERYVRRLRVERAKHLLASTEFPLQRISELTGFNHHSYFTSVFKADTGVTPVAFRRSASPYEVEKLKRTKLRSTSKRRRPS